MDFLIIWALIFLGVYLLFSVVRKGFKRTVSDTKEKIERAAEAAISEPIKMADRVSENVKKRVSSVDDEYFAEALREIKSGTQHEATWARALSMSDGDPKRAESNYIKLRSKNLSEQKT